MENTDNKELFASKGIKNTKHRNLIWEALKKSDTPITAEQLFLKLKEIDASINLSTVYRALNIFISKGLVLKSSISDDSTATFEVNCMEHKHHLVCISCKKVISIEGCPMESYEKLLEKSTDFDITGHKLEIFGYCPECKKHNEE